MKPRRFLVKSKRQLTRSKYCPQSNNLDQYVMNRIRLMKMTAIMVLKQRMQVSLFSKI